MNIAGKSALAGHETAEEPSGLWTRSDMAKLLCLVFTIILHPFYYIINIFPNTVDIASCISVPFHASLNQWRLNEWKNYEIEYSYSCSLYSMYHRGYIYILIYIYYIGNLIHKHRCVDRMFIIIIIILLRSETRNTRGTRKWRQLLRNDKKNNKAVIVIVIVLIIIVWKGNNIEIGFF